MYRMVGIMLTSCAYMCASDVHAHIINPLYTCGQYRGCFQKHVESGT